MGDWANRVTGGDSAVGVVAVEGYGDEDVPGACWCA
jgi:hypothetical protein